MTKRVTMPSISSKGHDTLVVYERYLRDVEDLSGKTIRNYLSDLRQFIAWCEYTWGDEAEPEPTFTPAACTTPLLTRYRTFLQEAAHLRPSSINRALISIKRYSAWCVDQGFMPRDPAKVVKLIPSMPTAPRHLTDQEEEAFVRAVTIYGSLRDCTLITLLLHTGLRVGEICHLQRQHIHLGKRSGSLTVVGKRNKYREVPLNTTARGVLHQYLAVCNPQCEIVFPSEKTGQALSERAVGYLVAKYAIQANIPDLHPHDLRHRFGYRMAESVPLHRLAQIMGHDSLNTTMIYIRGTKQDLQREVEKIAWQ